MNPRLVITLLLVVASLALLPFVGPLNPLSKTPPASAQSNTCFTDYGSLGARCLLPPQPGLIDVGNLCGSSSSHCYIPGGRAVCPGSCHYGVSCSSLGLPDLGSGFCPNDREWVCCGGGGGGGPVYPTPYAYPYPYPYPTPRYDITGTVFIDNNRNGARDGGDGTYSGLNVHLAGNATSNDTSNPGYAFNNLLCCRNYTVSIAVPAEYAATTATSVTTNLPGNRTINFGIVRIYTISGSVFNDVNKNYLKEGGETKDWPANAAFTGSGGTMTTNAAAGTFTLGGNLYAGTYTINYTGGIPAGYINRYPVNGPPPNLRVTVPSCAITPANPNPAYAVTCTNGNASNVNFVITNSIPWMQTYGLDVRSDNGLTDIIPIAPTYPKYVSDKN